MFCSTSNGFDKTVLAFKDKINTPMLFINDKELKGFIDEHMKEKMRYYSIYKFVMNNFNKHDDHMKSLIIHHRLSTKEKIIKFVTNEFNLYQTNRYPLNCLVVLDDFTNNQLLINHKSPLHTYFTKTRHHNNIIFIITVQIVKFVAKNVKRMLSDVMIYGLLFEEGFIGIMKELPISWNIGKLYQ